MSQKHFRGIREELLYDEVSLSASENSSAFTAQNIEVGQFMLTVTDWDSLTTLDCKVQARDPAGNWYDLGIAFAQLSDAGAELVDSVDDTNFNNIPLGKFLRFVITIVGTGTAVVTLSFIGKS